MGWRFRHSFKLIHGVRLNLSKTGLSCSVGGAPLTVNVGPRGVYGTASLPGTGISYRQRFGGSHQGEPTPNLLPVTQPHTFPDPGTAVVPVPLPIPTPASVPVGMPVQEVHSASTELLTSEGLKDFKQLLQTAFTEHEDIGRELETAGQEKQRASERYLSWENGFLLKRVFTKKFAQRKADSETADARVSELEEQLRLTTIATHIEIEREQAEPYYQMRDAFASLSESQAIWDVKSFQRIDKFHERSTADSKVTRQRVVFSLGSCDLLQWEQKVPHLQNAKGGDLFLYPGFILYRAAKEAFSVIDYHDVKGNSILVQFQELETVPKDSKVVGQAWVKANKDGSRDKRFANNYQIPIALYGGLSMKSDNGLWEEFHFSDLERLKRFLEAWNKFDSSFPATQKN
ncbi:MAG: hypothetical protein C5B59_00560 [Bacteroidetes bacterium]|nr:MAG: hypothetical protein C5B59_00560 [Bacteroidota bacterium]